ncbi:MAG TPA: type II toxin-antitoxin system VapC family toxin [Chloroflexota bacterium]|nr:type II toxin-antitoxin system VapC family toxin [Chloroflexota bacterium]
MVYYLVTSAIVKRYVREQGTDWVISLVDSHAGHEFYTVRIAGPELIAAHYRKVRTGEVVQTEADYAAELFRLDWRQDYNILEITEAVSARAMLLAQTQGLRGYDAVHLAAALEVRDIRQAVGIPALIFVSADTSQRTVAAEAGLPVENPNSRP